MARQGRSGSCVPQFGGNRPGIDALLFHHALLSAAVKFAMMKRAQRHHKFITDFK